MEGMEFDKYEKARIRGAVIVSSAALLVTIVTCAMMLTRWS